MSGKVLVVKEKKSRLFVALFFLTLFAYVLYDVMTHDGRGVIVFAVAAVVCIVFCVFSILTFFNHKLVIENGVSTYSGFDGKKVCFELSDIKAVDLTRSLVHVSWVIYAKNGKKLGDINLDMMDINPALAYYQDHGVKVRDEHFKPFNRQFRYK